MKTIALTIITVIITACAASPPYTPTPMPTPTNTATSIPTATNTPTVEPTATAEPTETPTATPEPSIGFSRDEVEAVFSEKYGFRFETSFLDSEQSAGMPLSSMALMDLVGPNDNLTSITLAISNTDDFDVMVDNAAYQYELLALVAPDWPELDNWLFDNGPTARNGEVVTGEWNGLRFTLEFTQSIGREVLTVEPVE